ncbi:cytidine and deoxycytidylate deaminase zinc-binding region family protein [Mycobacterium kansasii]|uniref:Cytidine and deoxycytidylate deaminase zinc-binding region family protein n=1 Tax=Mycobacterium kansasii TaxID=1768 RepID=A0A1V3WF37_MYCKA|nr:cytidine and deoxycytidylate deaminase zinc-binding region family protein [Mycobacterium kansasii]
MAGDQPMTVEQVKSIEDAMRLAIDQSYLVKGSTYPNPPVGAVIVDTEGRVVGVGGTQPTGGDHAEVVALRRPAVWPPAPSRWSPWSPATTTARLRHA